MALPHRVWRSRVAVAASGRAPGRAAANVAEQLEARYMLATVTVDTSQAFQTVRAIGGNYAMGRHTGSALVNDGVGRYTLDHLSPGRARVGIPLRAWEPVNDDADPATTGNFVDAGN